jgi:hypothetical protein
MPYPPKPDNPTEISQEHTLKGCIHYFDFSLTYMMGQAKIEFCKYYYIKLYKICKI